MKLVIDFLQAGLVPCVTPGLKKHDVFLFKTEILSCKPLQVGSSNIKSPRGGFKLNQNKVPVTLRAGDESPSIT